MQTVPPIMDKSSVYPVGVYLAFQLGLKINAFTAAVKDVKPICDNIQPFKVQLCDLISNNTFV